MRQSSIRMAHNNLSDVCDFPRRTHKRLPRFEVQRATSFILSMNELLNLSFTFPFDMLSLWNQDKYIRYLQLHLRFTWNEHKTVNHVFATC